MVNNNQTWEGKSKWQTIKEEIQDRVVVNRVKAVMAAADRKCRDAIRKTIRLRQTWVSVKAPVNRAMWRIVPNASVRT
jgi:hypothetical protein